MCQAGKVEACLAVCRDNSCNLSTAWEAVDRVFTQASDRLQGSGRADYSKHSGLTTKDLWQALHASLFQRNPIAELRG